LLMSRSSCSSHLHLLVLFFFFFQAEDGIRDRTVTGVQTCALPISIHALATGNYRTAYLFSLVAWPAITAVPAFLVALGAAAMMADRKKRRVGKECRCGWVGE